MIAHYHKDEFLLASYNELKNLVNCVIKWLTENGIRWDCFFIMR